MYTLVVSVHALERYQQRIKGSEATFKEVQIWAEDLIRNAQGTSVD